MDSCQQETPEQGSAKLMPEWDCAIRLSLQPGPRHFGLFVLLEREGRSTKCGQKREKKKKICFRIQQQSNCVSLLPPQSTLHFAYIETELD